MATFAQILAPVLLMLPALGTVEAPREMPITLDPVEAPTAEQVSIQQRVTVRIGPRSAPMPMEPAMFDSAMETGRGPRFVERKFSNCLSMDSIAGVQAIDNDRLLLILKDRRMLTARLEKGCQGREFYSGFIVARNSDAQICVGRDRLMSRSGMGCQVSGFKQLVQISD